MAEGSAELPLQSCARSREMSAIPPGAKHFALFLWISASPRGHIVNRAMRNLGGRSAQDLGRESKSGSWKGVTLLVGNPI